MRTNRKLQLLLTAVLTAMAAVAHAAVDDTFTFPATLNSTETVDMTFKVLTEEDGNYTVQVGDGKYSSIDKATVGAIEVPGEVTYNEHTYVVTKVGVSAFVYCKQITAVVLPSEITEIGNTAFHSCYNMASLNIPDKVVTIGENAFFATNQLKSITLPESLTAISNSGFNACGTTSIRIPKSVTSIGEAAFSQCQNLTSIVVDEENLVYDSRDNCNAIIHTSSNTLIAGCATTVIPNTVTTIANYGFYNVSITSLTIPESVTSIGEAGILLCQKLISVHIPKSVTSIGARTCNDCAKLTSLTVDSENPVYDSREGCNGIIHTVTNTLVAACGTTVIPTSVTRIGKRAYGSYRGTTVDIPDNITAIAEEAFYGSYITSIVIPASVQSIGARAFYQCFSLKTVVVKHLEPLTNVGPYCFSDSYLSGMTLRVPTGTKSAYEQVEPWKKFSKIVEEEPVKQIAFADANVKAICVANWDTNGDGEISNHEAAAVTSLGTVFKGNTTITSFDELQYFTSLVVLETEAFSGCNKLSSVVFPASLQVIYALAFYNCSSLQEPLFPDNLTQLQNQCFAFCTAFENLTIPKGLRSQNNAFVGCSNLKTIVVSADNQYYSSSNGSNCLLDKAETTLYLGCVNSVVPSTVKTISTNAFYGCGIESLVLPDGLTTIYGSAFANCSKLKSINLPAGITELPRMVFSGCTSLTSIQLPEALTAIGDFAFNNTGLIEVDIPSSVSTIGNQAFYSCNSLRKVTVHRAEPVEINIYAFGDLTYKNAILRVPAGSLTSYATATGWKNFNLIYDTDVPLRGDVNGDGEVNIADVTTLVDIVLGRE